MAYQEYPRHLHGADGAHVVVRNDAERDAKLAEGWALWPIADGEVAAPVAPAPPDAVAEVLEKPRRGRPKKAAKSVAGEGDAQTDRE